MDDQSPMMLPKLIPTRSPRGFTLVELMIVVVLIAALAAISAPAISQSIERNRLSQFNRDILSGFNEARLFSMRTGNAVLVDVDVDNDRIRFYEADSTDSTGEVASSCVRADTSTTANDQNTLLEVTPGEHGLDDMEIEEPDPAETTICISPSGKIVSPTGEVLSATQGSCAGRMNYLIPIIESNPEHGLGDLRDCVDDATLSAQREMDNFSMIHVSPVGQVRVIR